MHLVIICSFLVHVCREWGWISWTRIHVFHHGLVFSNLISFLVSFWVFRCVFPISGVLRILLVLMLYCWMYTFNLFAMHFGCHIFVQNCSFSLASACWHFLCHALPVVNKIYFCCRGMSCFVCIVLSFVNISLISLLSPYFSGLFPHVVLLFFLVMSFHFCFYIFQYLF